MSRLVKNEILKQYKKLHQEDIAQQQRLQGTVGNESAVDAAGNDGVEAATGVPPTETIEHDIDEFQTIGARFRAPNEVPSGHKPVAVPPAVARGTTGPSSASGASVRKQDPQGYGTDLDDDVAVHAGRCSEPKGSPLASSLPKQPSPPPVAAVVPGVNEHGDNDEDEFPDLDEVVAPPPSLPNHGEEKAYVSPVDQLRQEQEKHRSEANEDGIVSSTSDDESSEEGGVEADHGGEDAFPSSSESHSRNTPPMERLHSSANVNKADEVSGTAVTVSAMTTTATAAAVLSAMAAAREESVAVLPSSRPVTRNTTAEAEVEANPQKSSSPIDEALGPANTTFNVSNTSVDDPTSYINAGAKRRASQRQKWSMGDVSLDTIDGSTSRAGRPTTAPLAAAVTSPQSPPLTPQGLAAALRQSRAAAKDDNDDDDEAWVRAPLATGAVPPLRDTISFWVATRTLFRDKSSWSPYVVATASGPTGTNAAANRPTTTAKKKSSFFSCCSGGEKDVVERGSADAPLSPVIRDADFVLAMRAMPYNRKNTTEEQVLLSVYWGLVPAATDGEGSGRMASKTVSWERVGFQGADPATDLRSSGFLGLLVTLYLVDTYPLLTRKLWQLCNPLDYATAEEKKGITGTNCDLPLVLIVFNFLGVVLDLMQRDGKEKLVSASVHNRSTCFRNSQETGSSHAPQAFTPIIANNPEKVDGDTLRSFPLLHSLCECLVGTVEVFFESWWELRRAKRPALPFVGDFGAQKAKVHALVVPPPRGLDLVLQRALKARNAEALAAVETCSTDGLTRSK